MTVAGFRKCDGSAFALAWADGEVYRDGAAVGAMTKLAASAAGLVGVAIGFADLVGQYRDRIKAYGATSLSAPCRPPR